MVYRLLPQANSNIQKVFQDNFVLSLLEYASQMELQRYIIVIGFIPFNLYI